MNNNINNINIYTNNQLQLTLLHAFIILSTYLYTDILCGDVDTFFRTDQATEASRPAESCATLLCSDENNIKSYI